MDESQRTYDQIVAPIEAQMIRSIWQIVRNREDAEDAMQNALTTLWKRWRRVVGHPNPQALVLKVCVDAAYDQIRRRVRTPAEGSLTASHAEPLDRSPSPSEIAEAAEQYRELIATIIQMPRQQAIATLLRIVQGKSYGEIASVLGALKQQRENTWPAVANDSELRCLDSALPT